MADPTNPRPLTLTRQDIAQIVGESGGGSPGAKRKTLAFEALQQQAMSSTPDDVKRALELAAEADATANAAQATAIHAEGLAATAEADAAAAQAVANDALNIANTKGGPIEALDEGVSLTVALASLDFVGAGVTATVTGDAVTVTVPGGSGGTVTSVDIASASGDITVSGSPITGAGTITLTSVSAPKWTTGRTITLTGDATGVSGSFDGSGNLSFATVGVQASKWTTARTLSFTGDVTGSGSVDGSAAVATALTIANSAVTLAKIANASANSKLLGSGASGSGAAYVELTLGTNLSITGTTLNATAGGSGTVTSVTSSSGDITVATGTTTPVLTAVSSPKWTTARTLSFTGDVTGSGSVDGSASVATALTLATVTVPKGGTGAVTLTAHGVLIGNAASAVNATSAGTSGQVLTSNGASADPTFQSVGSSGSGAVAKLTILQKTANQSIANGTLTAASWDTTVVQDDIGAFSGASPTIVTVPSGYTKMRVSWYALWNSNSAGVRNTYVFKTGASSFPLLLGSAISAAVGSSESPNPHVSRWFTVATGDTYGIGLFQSSGGSLNFADTGTAATWGAPYVQFEWAP